MSSTSQATAKFFGIMFSASVLTVLGYAVCHYLGIATPRFSVWIISLVMVWWLAVVVTLPWNLYFQALGVIADAKRSRDQKITVDAKDLSYVERWAKLALVGAVALHVLTAVGFYLLGYYQIGLLGYYAAIAAMALILLRPAIRAYDYVASRIAQIGREVLYPRDDVMNLTTRIEEFKTQLTEHEARLDLAKPESWAAKLEASLAGMRTDVEALRASLEDLRRTNADDHRALARSAEQAAARVGEDSQVLGHVRELIRFFKQG